MGWCHPEISMEALLKVIKGFVDIIILASGYQSSGSTASWDSQNIKKALQWGIFFENVFEGLHSSDDYEGSIMELDAALLEMTSNPYFPQGLTNLSSETLTRGRDFVFKHLIHTLPLMDAHLTALLTAAVEMDLDALRATEYDCLSVYLEKLMLQNPDPESPQTEKNVSSNHSEFILQELSKRQAFVSCVSSVETNLSILSKSLTCRKWDGSGSTMLDMRSHDAISLLREDQLVELEAWKKWRSRTISYLLDKRTVKLVSGAKLIFSAPKVQWFQVFERLRIANGGGDLLEIIELFLLGCISSNWSHLIEQFMSVSYDPLPISKQYYEVHNLLQGRSQSQHPRVETMNPQENDIVEYLAVLLRDQQHLLWKLSPILAATAIPSWSPLFKLYFMGVERLFSGYPFIIRCCSCIQDCREHKDYFHTAWEPFLYGGSDYRFHNPLAIAAPTLVQVSLLKGFGAFTFSMFKDPIIWQIQVVLNFPWVFLSRSYTNLMIMKVLVPDASVSLRPKKQVYLLDLIRLNHTSSCKVSLLKGFAASKIFIFMDLI